MKPQVITAEELKELMDWRREVLTEVFGVEPNEYVMEANKEYFTTEHFSSSFVLDRGKKVGCGIVCFQRELPSPDNINGKCAYLMNIYVKKDYRGRGFGTKLVNLLVEVARAEGCCKIYLESTDGARELYSRLGFKPLDNIMKL